MTGWMTSNEERTAGRRFPLGPWGVGMSAATLGALAGLLIPMGWIEEVSWQLYLDQLIASARAPLGLTARLVAAALLAVALGIVGWLVALFLNVRPVAGGLAGWLASLRSIRPDDEPDAPVLRSADRHPDAPARRPFSAARDVPAEEDVPDGNGWKVDDDGEELLLDAHFDEGLVATVDSDPERAERWDALEIVDDQDERVAAPVADAAAESAVEKGPVGAAMIDRMPEPAPLDLSVARLDELIARLESGLNRRQQAVTVMAERAPAVSVEPADVAAEALDPVIARGDSAADETSFPHDPALAAALATLRRMNRSS